MNTPVDPCYRCREALAPEDYAAGRAFRVGSLSSCGNCVDFLLSKLTKDQRRALIRKNPLLANPQPPTPRRVHAAQPRRASPLNGLSPETEAAAEAQAALTPPEALPVQGRGHSTTGIVRLVGQAATPGSSRNGIVIGAIATAAVIVTGLIGFFLIGQTTPPRDTAATPPPSRPAASPPPSASVPAADRKTDPVSTIETDVTRLNDDVKALVTQGDIAKALSAVQAAAGRHDTFAWTVAVQKSRREVEAAAETAYPALRERARRALLRGNDAEVARIRAEIESWSMSRHAADLREALAESHRDLVGWWRLDEREGSTARDASGLGHHGRLVGNPAWQPSGGRIEGGLRFNGSDGSDDYVELPLTPTLDGVHRTAFTLAAWVCPATVPPGRDAENNAYYGILIRPGLHVGLSYLSSAAYAMSLWIDKNSQVTDLVYDTPPSPPKRWRHVAATVHMATGRAALYVDGRPVRSRDFRAGAGPLDFGKKPWTIGIAAPGATEWRWAMDGTIDDVRIYGRALAEDEVLALFEAGLE